MRSAKSSRRRFLRHVAGGAAAGAAVPYWLTSRSANGDGPGSKNDRPLVAGIGVGGQGTAILRSAARFGDVVAVCDADLEHAERAQALFGGKPAVYQDYRRLLDRKDVEVITNGTPDHWHTAINIAACKAGKDVYTEKPLSLTIEEGQLLRKVVQQTGRIVQVGTQQRSDPNFRLACELVRNGRIGKLRRVTVVLPFWNTKGGPFAPKPVPPKLDWDLWQGQAPWREYCPERVHFNFRWWSEYAGGIITDWGQHHMDIAFWGMDMENSGPLSVEGTAIFPNQGRPNCYDNPDRFVIKMQFPGDIELLYLVAHDQKYRESITPQEEARLFAETQADLAEGARNGIMFTGDQGRLFVNRGKVYGKPVEQLKENPLPPSAVRLYQSNDHMGNFFECVKTRKQPISTVEVAHRVITACHLGNIAIRLKRKIIWDAQNEQIVGDAEAASSIYVRRPQRAPYQITA
ncbi:MAG: Gfo/Idh/MocA family protein [Thermoguttaceae bacterium]